MCKINSGGKQLYRTRSSIWRSVMAYRGGREGIYVYLELIHFVIQQETTHCKAIILQLKLKNKKAVSKKKENEEGGGLKENVLQS